MIKPKDDRILFYINENELAYADGISMDLIAESNGKMAYTIREDLQVKLPSRGSKFRISLVRENRAVYQIMDNIIESSETLNMDKIFNNARVEDAVVIELLGLP